MNDVKILDVNSVKESQLPDIIATQFTALMKLEDNVQKAVDLAVKAKQKANNAQVPAGLGKKKVAIELLQDATNGLAEAQISAADAQRISFEYQTRLTEITKFLFGLGVSNLAMNRSVVRELELKLKGASDEEISDLAKQELKNVIIQLKAQEDILKKQTQLSNNIFEQQCQIDDLNNQIDVLEEQEQYQDRALEKQVKKDEEHDRQLAEQAKKDEEHDRQLAEQAKKDEELDHELAEQVKKDEEHDRQLAEQAKKDKELDRELVEQAKRILQLNNELQLLSGEIENIKTILATKTNKIVTYISMGVSSVALLLTILQLIL